MAEIHHSAILEGDIDLADDVVVGPNCVLTGPITIGPGTRLHGAVWLQGPLQLGAGNTLYPHVCLGFAPQDAKWDPNTPGAGLRVGDDNLFREGVTIHRATSEDEPTTIGDHTFWMANTHAGHDCRIGDHCVFANGTLLAGHVRIDERVIMGGHAVVHQYCRVGRGAMLSGLSGTGRDLPPFFVLTGINHAGSLNVIGLRRSGMPSEDIEDVRWVFKTLYRRGLSIKAATEEIRSRADRPIVREYIEFIETSQRGICPGTADARR